MNYAALQEPGRYLAGIGLVAAGPQRHSTIVSPPLAEPESKAGLAALIYGRREMELAVALVWPLRLVWLPTTVITPSPSTDPELTNLVAVILQLPVKAELTLVPGAF